MNLHWTADPVAEHGVLDRGFTLELDGRRVPGVLLTPQGDAGPLPLVLLGHGQTLDKRHPAPFAVARRLSRRERFAVALLDQPGHGDRPREEDALSHAARRELAVADWTAALDVLTALPEVDPDRVGYWGLSMGTDYGLPFVAANPRVTVAVLGLFGAGSGDRIDEQAVSLARTLTASVLWVMQWDDTVFERVGQLALFDAVGSDDKRMIVYPGDHGDTPDEGLRLVREFLVRELGRVAG